MDSSGADGPVQRFPVTPAVFPLETRASEQMYLKELASVHMVGLNAAAEVLLSQWKMDASGGTRRFDEALLVYRLKESKWMMSSRGP